MMRKIIEGNNRRGRRWCLYEHLGHFFFSDDTYTLAAVDYANGLQCNPEDFDPETYDGDILDTTEADLNFFGLSKSSAADE